MDVANGTPGMKTVDVKAFFLSTIFNYVAVFVIKFKALSEKGFLWRKKAHSYLY